MLFEDKERKDDSPKSVQESDYQFLDRCSRDDIGQVRDLMNSLIVEYPASELDELISRIQSKDKNQYRSASFELLLHEALRRLGCTLQPHPDTPGRGKPDFLVTLPDGQEMYLEAVCASERGDIFEMHPLVASFFEYLDQRPHENFHVSVDYQGNPATAPKSRKTTNELHSWLDDLDPDRVITKGDEKDIDTYPAWDWTHEKFSVKFRALPIKSDRRGYSKRLIGLYNGDGGYVNAWEPIRDAASSKGGKKYDPDKPLVVAVNCLMWPLDVIDEVQALFGQEAFIFKEGEDESGFAREKNGLWRGPNGIQNQRISAVWIVEKLLPYSLAKGKNTIYLNPEPHYPLQSFFKMFPQAYIEGERIARTEGASFPDIFNIPPDWPGT